MKTSVLNLNEMINEISILMVSYFMTVFSSFVKNVRVRYDMGLVCVNCVLLSVIVNVVCVIMEVDS